LKECVVAPKAAVTQQGTTVVLTAAAYLNSGGLAPGFDFDWSSSNINVAKVDSNGLVNGGSIAGSSTITASVTRCPSTTCTAQITNVSAVQAGHTRVLAVDEFAGTAIEGATVVVGSQPAATTDITGAADLSIELSSNNPADITVAHAGYNYVTFKGVESNDVIIHLRRIPDPTKAGGIREELDYSRFRCGIGDTCDIRIGYGLISTPGDFFDVDFTLSSQMVCTEIELGGNTEVVPTPAGFSLCLNQTCFKQFSSTVGVPGKRVAFGFGGKADLMDFIEVLHPFLGGEEELHPGKLLYRTMALYSGFYTGIVPNVDVRPIDNLTDVADVDCDEDSTDLIPDYDNFTSVDIALQLPAEQVMTFTAPQLPVGTYDIVVVMGGAIVRDSGFIILGIGAGVDSKGFDDPEDGVIDEPIVLKVSDVAGRIPEDNVQRVIVVGALNASASLHNEDRPFAAQVILVDSFEGNYTLEEFLTPPAASYDPVTRHLEFSQVHDNADCFRAAFSDDKDSSWHVFTDEMIPIDLPAAPSEGDRSSTANLISIDLIEGLSYQDLPSFNDTNLIDLALLVKAFSYTKVASP
jgi:hypothetical protein